MTRDHSLHGFSPAICTTATDWKLLTNNIRRNFIWKCDQFTVRLLSGNVQVLPINKYITGCRGKSYTFSIKPK